MYENGRRVNGYFKKHIHKNKIKQRYINTWLYGKNRKSNLMAWPEFKAYVEKISSRPIYGCYYNHALKYWKQYYLTGSRKYSKRETARRARQQFREAISKCIDWNDFDGLTPYHKNFDYSWTVW